MGIGEGVIGLVDVERNTWQIFELTPYIVQKFQRHVLVVISGVKDYWARDVPPFFKKNCTSVP